MASEQFKPGQFVTTIEDGQFVQVTSVYRTDR
jgi:hypothetical protein